MKRGSLIFVENEQILTLGVELELQVLGKDTLLLTPRAQEIIEHAHSKKLKPEFFQSTLEAVTGICQTVQDAENDLRQTLDLVRTTAERLNLKISSTGTHPEADYRDRIVTPSPRYHLLMDRNQWIIRRMAVYGMHVHLGMKSGDDCIRFHNFFLNFVPHFLALSASSPFWQQMHTGLASSRPTMYEAMPTSGMPYTVKNWKQFDKMFQALVRTGSIAGMSDLWLDLRPSPQLGTLELRIFDEPATLAEALAIVSYVHLLGMWYEEHQDEWERENKVLPRWILRENKWRALRYGLKGEMVLATNKTTVQIKENIQYWMDRLSPYAKKFNYENYFSVLEEIVNRGNSAERQLGVFQQTDNLHEVVKHNVKEFELGQPNWSI